MIDRLVNSTATKVVALVVALAAVGLVSYELFKPSDKKTAVAYFPLAVHL
jgi:hypothetical protein